MTALSKPLSTPAKPVTAKPQQALKAAPTKSVQIKPKPRVTAKVPSKSTVKPTTSKGATTQVKPVAPTPATNDSKLLKSKKIKLVRDSFTIPKSEYLVLDDLKLRANELKHPVKKGELLRAGIKALAAMTATQLHAALQAVPALKTGRPSK